MSYLTYAKYRDSGFKWIGNIPESWEVRRLKNVLDSPITDGPHSTPEFLYEGIPFLSVDGIQDGELQFEGCRYVSIADHQQFAKKAAPRKGDVLLGKAASTGKIAQVKVDFEFNIWSPLALLRPNQAEITPTFLEYALKSPAVQAQIDVLCTHNTQSNISMDDIPKLVLPLPSNVEQQQIASFLDWKTSQIDALIAKKKELMEKLKEKRLAVITQAVTKGIDTSAQLRNSGIPWLGDVPKHWKVKRLRFAVTKIEQGWSPQCDNQPAEEDAWGVMKVGCVNGDEFDPLENKSLPAELVPLREYELKPKDILISRANTKELLGSAAIVPNNIRPRLLLCDKLFRLCPDPQVDEEFLTCYLRTPAARYQYEREATGSSGSMQNIGQGTLKNLVVAFPPLAEQRSIFQYIRGESDKVDMLMQKTEYAIARLTEYRTALITAATTGKIDVRHVAIPAPT